jgi:hypothetical protein
MRPQTIGRTVGTGLRVAGRIAGQRLAAGAQAAAAQAVTGPPAQPAGARTGAQATLRTGQGVKQGIGGFLRPFRRVGGILWLEVTGVFFLLPVLVFAPTVWRSRLSWAHGPNHRTFWVATLVVAVFFYLGVSSFWRARRK